MFANRRSSWSARRYYILYNYVRCIFWTLGQLHDQFPRVQWKNCRYSGSLQYFSITDWHYERTLLYLATKINDLMFDWVTSVIPLYRTQCMTKNTHPCTHLNDEAKVTATVRSRITKHSKIFYLESMHILRAYYCLQDLLRERRFQGVYGSDTIL